MNTNHRKVTHLLFFLTVLISILGCSSIYYAAWEKLGKQKRDLLRDSVIAARDDQKDAGKDLRDALTRLRDAYGVTSSTLQRTYDDLNGHYRRVTGRYDDLSARIDKMNRIAGDLFAEWKEEANSMKNSEFRQESLSQLRETKARFDQMSSSLRASQNQAQPVLQQFRDYVLFLKHNLNAEAIGGLQSEARSIEDGLSGLIAEMNRSIAETDSFIRTLK